MSTETYSRIEQVLHQLVDMPDPQPSLSELASSVGLSDFHFQRLFKEWVGISPKKFIQHLSLEAAKQRLRQSNSVLDASLDVGLSGPSRLHDLMISLEAMTPGEYKSGGKGLAIFYGQHDTPFGLCTLFMTNKGVCGLQFLPVANALSVMQSQWPAANFIENTSIGESVIAQAFRPTDSSNGRHRPTIALYVKGSVFQVKVWQALLSIPQGQLNTYGAIATQLQMGSQGARAVGRAVGSNPVGWLIPCHRVIQQTGALSGYRWGRARKLGMLGWEASREEGVPK